MDSPLKQRLIGAAVLVALAVIFLPMLVQGPAPDSGVTNVPLSMPDTPRGEYQTRDLPLVSPGDAPAGGAVGLRSVQAPAAASTAVAPSSSAGGVAPTSSVAAVARAGAAAPATSQPLTPDHALSAADAPLPAVTAGGDYAVNLGTFSTQASADAVIAALHASQLPGYREATSSSGKPAWRVRVGPYATRADAEAARLRAARVRNVAGAQVVALDAQTVATAIPASTLPADQKPGVAPIKITPVQSAQTTTTVKRAEPKPVPAQTAPAVPAVTATTTGFAIQLAAFSKTGDATALRDKLRAAGFTAFTESVATDKGTLTRVRVGPVVTRAEADQLKAQVKAKLGLDGIVRPHP